MVNIIRWQGLKIHHLYTCEESWNVGNNVGE